MEQTIPRPQERKIKRKRKEKDIMSLTTATLIPALLLLAFGVPLHLDSRLSERFFGRWEGLRWDAIWAETGSAMDGMIEAPDHFRPGGGETTNELAGRVADWFRTLPCQAIVAVTHGGPIAALVGMLRDEPVRGWLRHIPAPGEGFQLTARTDGWTIAPWRMGRAGQ